MRRIFARSLLFVLLAVGVAGGVVALRAVNLYRTAKGGFDHIRYLLESGETVEGSAAEDVLSDNYLLSLFGNNPELVDRLKTVVELGMATDATLKLGSVAAMVVTYRKGADGSVQDAAIYAVGGFPDPKSRRLGFHASGYFSQEFDPSLWLSGNAVMHLLGRDIIVFCEQDKAEAHMALLFDLLNGGVMPLAQKVVDAPLYYAIVFPEPGEVAPPNLKNHLQTIIIRGEMTADTGRTEIQFMCPNIRSAAQILTTCQDMISLARVTFHDRYGGFIKDMSWGKMNDNWWAVEYVDLCDAVQVVQDQSMVVVQVDYDRFQNNALLKTVERAGRDMAAQKAFTLAGDLPWEFAFREKDNPSGGYWNKLHMEGPEWPLGDFGIQTPGSIAAAKERERIRAEKEAKEREERERKAAPAAADAPVAEPT